MKLFTKVMLIFEYYLYTAYRISETFYREDQEPIVGTGQGNRFSGDFCRDTLGLVIRVPEKQELGIMIRAPILQKQTQELAIRFIDDINFNSNRNNIQEKIQIILNIYLRSYKATGEHIEYNKTIFYSWQ